MSAEAYPQPDFESTPYNVQMNEDGDVIAPSAHDAFDGNGPDPMFDFTYSTTRNDAGELSPSRAEVADEPEIPLAVSLADRALALESMMTFLSKNNMTKGSRSQVTDTQSDFSQRYRERADDIQAGAERKRHELFAGFVRGIQVLNASEAKHRLGHDPEEVRLEEIALKKSINDEFLSPGMSRERKAAVARAKRAAGIEE